MIRIRNLQFGYGSSEFSLSIPALDVAAGEHLAITGPSGCGKTTLLEVLSGVLRANSGVVRVGEAELNSLSDASRRRFRITSVGQVFQDLELLDSLRLGENILLPYFINGALKLDSAVRARAESLAESVGLHGDLKRPVTHLSRGERQRLAICRALITRPQLILADEPTGNLDPTSKNATMKLLYEQTRAAGATLVVVTHDHGLLDLFDRHLDFAEIVGEASEKHLQENRP